MRPPLRPVALLTLLLLHPLLAHATGSVMLWGSYPQLVLGNFFIALLEVYAIRKRYGLKVNSWVLLFANYFSLVIAFLFGAGGFTQLIGLDFWGLASESGWGYTGSLFVGLLVAFPLAVLVEWPFLMGTLYLLKKQPDRKLALRLSIFAQCISFAFIAVYLVVMSLVG